MSATFAKYGLQKWEFDVLATLFRSGGEHEMLPSELVRRLMVTNSTVTNRIDRLQQAGLVIRKYGGSDGRHVGVKLTGAGRRLIREVIVDHLATERRMLEGLTDDERRLLASLLRKLSNSIQTDR